MLIPVIISGGAALGIRYVFTTENCQADSCASRRLSSDVLTLDRTRVDSTDNVQFLTKKVKRAWDYIYIYYVQRAKSCFEYSPTCGIVWRTPSRGAIGSMSPSVSIMATYLIKLKGCATVTKPVATRLKRRVINVRIFLILWLYMLNGSIQQVIKLSDGLDI